MRLPVSLSLLIALFLSSCTPGYSEEPPGSSPPLASITAAESASPQPVLATPSETPKPSPTQSPPTPTAEPTISTGFSLVAGSQLPPEGPLIAYEVDRDQDRILLLADPAEGISYEFSFPAEARFATPFLVGLSPDARYFVYFEGGWLETLYDVEHLRASEPDLVLHILDLQNGEIIFSAPLLSPSFPQDLEPVAEMIKDEWWFTNSNASFDDVVAATEEMMLDRIRNVAWSPDGSLLAYPSQDPGPTSDLYLFNIESRTAQHVTTDPDHVLRMVWAPDSSALVLDTSLFDRHAREDTTYFLSREGSLLTSFTSQIWDFNRWHDSTHAFLYEGTDAGDYSSLQVFSAVDGTIGILWGGSYAEIAFSPDLSTFLFSCNIPTAPEPSHAGLFMGKSGDDPLLSLSEPGMGWGAVTYWGSAQFMFAASSVQEGTVGVTQDGERVTIDDGYWKLAPSPDGSFLAGHFRSGVGVSQGIFPGLRVFGEDGLLFEAVDDLNVTCVHWNAASTSLMYQAENLLYIWDAADGSTRLISDQLNKDACSFKWVREPIP